MAKDEQWITVQEAARRLGVKEDAIRKRIQRGSLRHEKDPKDGRVYVYLDATQDASQDGTYDESQDAAEDTSYVALVNALHDQVTYLRGVIETRDRELEARTEELRRKDHIIAALTERIPELEPASEPRESHESASEDDGREEGREGPPSPSRRPWWQRMFNR